MKYNLIPFPSTIFSYNSTDKTFTAEASDLGNRHLQQIYDDACDVGFSIQSGRTGSEVTYYMDTVNKVNKGTDDEEIGSWTYLPLPECVRKHPLCAGTKVIIFND